MKMKKKSQLIFVKQGDSKIEVRFRKEGDVSNQAKDQLIDALPGPYKVDHEDLNDMNRGKFRAFGFKTSQVAARFATRLLAHAGGTFDVKPGFAFGADLQKK